jgi:hypothetical protein
VQDFDRVAVEDADLFGRKVFPVAL